MIIHFNGMPGVGKQTVAEILANKINARLIDNHLLIDLVLAVCERGSAEYISMLKKIMAVVLEQIAETPDQTFIFTNALSAESKGDTERLDQIRLFAENHKIPFVQILLKCGLEENKRRIVSENRKLKGKLMNPDELEKLQQYTIYHPSTEFAFEIDTT
ncbi:MAG: AAA family ATPase [Blastocatellia bacterium]|nr:AAA family ATPase [Blastocatellia bacterium]